MPEMHWLIHILEGHQSKRVAHDVGLGMRREPRQEHVDTLYSSSTASCSVRRAFPFGCLHIHPVMSLPGDSAHVMQSYVNSTYHCFHVREASGMRFCQTLSWPAKAAEVLSEQESCWQSEEGADLATAVPEGASAAAAVASASEGPTPFSSTGPAFATGSATAAAFFAAAGSFAAAAFFAAAGSFAAAAFFAAAGSLWLQAP